MSDIQLKWDAIYHKRGGTTPQPATMLSAYTHLLPTQGLALDLACGLGGNSFFLTMHGLKVDAWDISTVAIEHINNNCADVTGIQASVVDISHASFPTNHYDVIVVSRFLDRQIIPQLIDTLKIGGLIFYQTFTLEKAHGIGPKNPVFLLKRGELLSLFPSLSAVIYHEEACIGNLNKGTRNEAILIAQKL
ncbi:MAG TPA: methyltransferase domain-containing protein [Cycloclasticus sp.]|jgi:SAM-dependent methyltransferase|nr:methyltransferase domain-containing protein [Cycloclasticus sp.]HIL91870.1 methyltransferase domain-containing protein [Cycloclasticus sp.]